MYSTDLQGFGWVPPHSATGIAWGSSYEALSRNEHVPHAAAHAASRPDAASSVIIRPVAASPPPSPSPSSPPPPLRPFSPCPLRRRHSLRTRPCRVRSRRHTRRRAIRIPVAVAVAAAPPALQRPRSRIQRLQPSSCKYRRLARCHMMPMASGAVLLPGIAIAAQWSMSPDDCQHLLSTSCQQSCQL